MKKRYRIVWTRQAREDLRGIRDYIARDAPITAMSFVRRLRSAVDRLQRFPESGSIVPEFGNPMTREVFYGYYRIIYRFRNDVVEILTVFHGARLLDETQL
jgi:plasmid stabilization system protein ParE